MDRASLDNPARAQPPAIERRDWPRLLALVEASLDVPADERDAWRAALRLETALDESLRGLLQERRAFEAAGFLDDLPELPGGAGLQAVPPRMAAGAAIGPWRLLREIGEGGMSIVWLAERADGQLTRRVALKLPHAGPGHDLLAQRLLRERAILAALEHRHIARLYDVGVTDEGVPYLVMEYVEGDTLLAFADARRWTLRQRLAVFRQVLSAVQYAHGKLVLHRDLKPQNILVDGDGDAKLLDFGIAKLLSARDVEAEATDLTQATGRRLTPAYASPEQLRGEPLGTASDVYSLGVVLYELASGRRPFEFEGLSVARIEQAILEQEPRPLARQGLDATTASMRGTTPAALRRALTGDLDAIVLKALAKAPERRYASVDAFDADVARWLAGKPVVAHPPGRLYYLAKFVRRHRWPVGLGTAAVCAVVTAGAVALVQARVAAQQAERANAVRDFLVGMFQDTDPDRPDSREFTARNVLEDGARRARTQLARTPDQMAEMLKYIGNAQYNLSDITGADRTLEQAIAAYRSVGDARGELVARLARTDNALAAGRIPDAQAQLAETMAMAAPFADDVVVTGALLREQGYVAGFRHEWTVGRDALRRYLVLADQHPQMPALERAEVLENLASSESHLGELPAALAHVDEAFATLQRHPEIPFSARMDVLVYQQDIEFQWGRYGAIERTSPDAIRQCTERLSPHSQTCLKLALRLAWARLRLGLADEAAALESGLTPMLDPASPRDRLMAAAAIARALARSGQLDARPGRLAQLVEIARSPALTSLSPSTQLVALNALAEVHLLARRPEEAQAWIAQAERLATSQRLEAGTEWERTRALAGTALDQRGRPDEALHNMAALCAAPAGAGSMTFVYAHYLRLACVHPLVATGQVDAAIALLKATLPVLDENFGTGAPTVRVARRWLESLQHDHALPAATGTAPVFG